MDATVARGIAQRSHLTDCDRFGSLVIEHVERVAASVPEHARTVAFLHDVVGRTPMSMAELCERGLTPLEQAALVILTREPGESYELHALRIAWAGGEAGTVARAVKLADLDDHLTHYQWAESFPPYDWARRHISFAVAQRAA
jgi:hypothetical protein